MVFDPQVNGYLNVDFSNPRESEEDIRMALREYLRVGADSFLPTLITSTSHAYSRSLPKLSRIISEEEFKNRIPGLHLEGPFISAEAGAVGAHNPDWVQKPSVERFKRLQESAGGKITLVTLAAECTGSAELCRYLTDRNIIVSLGHQMAQIDDLSRLYDKGASLLTHLGNGMPNRVHRHNNSFVNGLLCPGLTPMIIGDSFHLPLNIVRGIIELRGVKKVIITSDASPLAGMPPGEYVTLNNRAVLTKEGLLHNPDKGCLVGSAFTLNECRENFMEQFSEEDLKNLFARNFLSFLPSA